MSRFKRFFDLSIIIVLAPALLPLVLIIAAMILLLDGPPIFFRQLRTGYREKLFSILKFRTLSRKNGRPSPLGLFLRKYGLDELPQVWNVLKGELSLVGPRPLLPEYLPRYNRRQRQRHNVAPGITGLAQIHGRNELTWEEKLEWDARYVEERSLWLDSKILLLTCLSLHTGRGSKIAPPFLGNHEH